MFELDKYDVSLHRAAPLAPEIPYEPASDVTGMSLLLWAEHCVECAAPACYTSCDLYQPRSDLRCRRFTYGAYKNSAFASLRGYGVEVAFKKWGKLEAIGNTAIRPVPTVLRWEHLLERGAFFTNTAARALSGVTGDFDHAQLTYTAAQKLCRALQRRAGRGPRPDAFLLELYNPEQQPVRLQMVWRISPEEAADKRGVPPPVIRTLTIPTGYSRHRWDATEFRAILDDGRTFLISILPEGDSEARLVFLSADLVKLRTPTEASGASAIKCLVWDLDQTLWEGVLVEGDAISLRPGVSDILKQLDERGILLSVISKNDYQSAWDKLNELGVADYFLYPQIDWRPKSAKIKTLAAKLNIGLDTFAIIDDNPFELAEVSQALPEVVCLPAERAGDLLSDPRFQGSSTDEARQRRGLYRTQMVRETEQETFGSDYLGFLAQCQMVLELAGYHDGEAERVAELAQRTNQLNFSGHKYTRDELARVIANPELEKYVLRCSDRYGSYGTVGFAVVRAVPETIEILDFMLSCRVQGRLVEQAFFGHLLAHHNPWNAQTVAVSFRPTRRNRPAQTVLAEMGFVFDPEQDATQTLYLREPARLRCEYIAVRCLRESAAVGVPLAAP
jgi:FkbH-like protein